MSFKPGQSVWMMNYCERGADQFNRGVVIKKDGDSHYRVAFQNSRKDWFVRGFKTSEISETLDELVAKQRELLLEEQSKQLAEFEAEIEELKREYQ